MDTTSSASWRRSVRSRAAAEGERGEEEADGELRRRVEELEAAVERLRLEKEEAEAEEAALSAELDAERGASETAASEAMLMIERLQREKAAALMEARQFRRLAEGRADRDRELHDELASVSALAASYLSLLHAHGIDHDDEDEHAIIVDDDDDESKQKEGAPCVQDVDGESKCSSGGGSGSDVNDTVAVQAAPSPLPRKKEFEHTDVSCTAAAEECAAVDDNAGDLYARVEALEMDRAAMRGEVAALQAERGKILLAREMARRLCREAAAAERSVAVAAEKPRFSVLAVYKPPIKTPWSTLDTIKEWKKKKDSEPNKLE